MTNVANCEYFILLGFFLESLKISVVKLPDAAIKQLSAVDIIAEKYDDISKSHQTNGENMR